jgi:hypothetical protein
VREALREREAPCGHDASEGAGRAVRELRSRERCAANTVVAVP